VTAASGAGTSESAQAVTAPRPSYNEDSAWCQAHGHTGILAGCPTCDHLLATDPAFARLVEDQVHNLDGTRGRRNGHTAPPIR
jgi:hypothetical protein